MKSDRKSRNPIDLSEVLLRISRAEETEDSENPEEVVTRAEARAREDQKKAVRRSAQCIGSKREYADSLHRQADILHHRGDYEAALVLYHRATTAYPRDPRHGVAVRRTSAAISSATNPSGALKKFLSGTKNAAQLAANYCPETAALKARRLLEESPDPVSAIDQILKYFDSRKDFWRDPQSAQDRRRAPLVPQSKLMLHQFNAMASAALQNLQAASASGDAISTMRIGEELMAVSGALPDANRYQVWARHYLSMAQISLGRHDRAVDQASRMVALARESGDAVLRSRSMATLGRVHLSFGHLEAAARAWEKLVPEVEDAVPKSWLLHEIGRCYFEMKRHGRALETARRCLEYAEEGNSRKWLLHGKLLSGQALVELGRLGEAVEVLRAAGNAALEEEDCSTVEYVKDLIDRVTGLLRRDVCPEEDQTKDEAVKREGRGWRAWSKSDDALREGRSSEWNLCGSSGRAAKSRIAGRSQPTKRGRMRNVRVRRAQRRGKDIGRIGNSALTVRPSGSGSLDLRRSEEVDPVESPMRMRAGRYRRKNELPTRRGGDVDRGDLLTSRTRVSGKAARSKDSGRKSEDSDWEGSRVDVERGDLLTSRTRVIGKAGRNKDSGRKSEDSDWEGSRVDVERGDLLTSRTRVIGKVERNKDFGRKSEDSDWEGNQVDVEGGDLLTSRTRVIGKAARNKDSGRKSEDSNWEGNQVDIQRGDLFTSRTRVIGRSPRNKDPRRKSEVPDWEGNQVDVERCDPLTSTSRVIGKAARNKDSGRKSEVPDGKGNHVDEAQVACSGSEKSDNTEIAFLIDRLRTLSPNMDQKLVNLDAGAVKLLHGGAEVTSRSPIDPGDSVTSRTQVISKGASRIINPSRKSDPHGKANPLDEDQLGFDSKKSSNEGVNFVIDELRKFSIIMDQNPASWDVGSLELFDDEVEVSGTSQVVRLLNGPKSAEHFGDEQTEDFEKPEISRSRARSNEEEDVGFSLSPSSPASTGKTYLVDEGEKMSPSGPRSRSGDYRETVGNEKKYLSPFDISSEGLSRRNDDSKIARNVPGTIVDATGDSIFGGEMKKTMSVKNVSVPRSIEEVPEKHNCEASPTLYGLFDEHRGNETRGLRAGLEEHLAIGKSISTSRSYGLAFSTGRNPPIRDSRSTSPRIGNKLPSP